MNAPQIPAETGHWTDFATGQRWYVATATWGYVLPAFVGIWLSFSAKYLKQIAANIALHILLGSPQFLTRGGAPTEETLLLEPPEPPAPTTESVEDKGKAQALAKIYKKGGGIRDFADEFRRKRENLSPGGRFWLRIFIVVLSVVNGAFIIGGVYVGRIKANGPAILDSQKCGLWVFNRERGGDEAATRAGIHDLDKETRAGEYAQNCYGTPDMFDAIQCNFLYRSRLPFSPAQYTTDCPFQNEVCGQNQTVTFTTDTVDASELGINSRHSPKFRRSTSCTPLSMEHPFIQNRTVNGTTTYYYYYGEKPLHNPPLNYTYTTTGDPFDRLAPAYDVFAYTTSSSPIVESYWKPRPELTYPEFSTLTLIFISSLRILYKKWSDDPIFPADKEVYLPGERKPWFRNSDPRARPLACINFIEVCLGDGKTCWPMNAHLPQDASGNPISPPPEFWLMYASLLKTDIYNAIEKRLGRGLIAQSKVSQFFSDVLNDNHWVDEVERFVATSHARTQINAWSIASGEDSIYEGKDRYTLITPKEIYGNLCGIFKYNPPGYASIHYVWFCIIILFLPIFWLLSLKWPWELPWSKKAVAESQLSETEDVQQVGEAPPENVAESQLPEAGDVQQVGEAPPDNVAATGDAATPGSSTTRQPTRRGTAVAVEGESSSPSVLLGTGTLGHQLLMIQSATLGRIRSQIEIGVERPGDDGSLSQSGLANVPLSVEQVPLTILPVGLAVTIPEPGPVTTEESVVSQSSRPAAANAPSDSAGQEETSAPPSVENVISQAVQTADTTTKIPTGDPVDIIWEPLVFEGIIEWVWWLLASICYYCQRRDVRN